MTTFNILAVICIIAYTKTHAQGRIDVSYKDQSKEHSLCNQLHFRTVINEIISKIVLLTKYVNCKIIALGCQIMLYTLI